MTNPFGEWLGRELDGGERFHEYGEVLRSERWKWIGTLLRRWHEDRCQICDSAIRLSVHHLNYRRIGYEQPSDLLLVCKNCHRLLHESSITADRLTREHPDSWDRILRDVGEVS